MKVLFVASGNSKSFDIVPFIKAQGESLRAQGVEMDYFPITGKGLKGYLESSAELKKHLKNNPPDIIHAHYTLSGWVAVMARTGMPIVLSIMGDDAYGSYVGPGKVVFKSRYLTLLTLLIQPFVRAIISKSANIDRYVFRRGIANIVPNGIQLEKFKNHEKPLREELDLDPNKQYVLFLGDKSDVRKNYPLIEEAVRLLNAPGVELLTPYPVGHDQVAKYLDAADAFALTAFMEGSPNVVKEAMACNCPIVATDVGDVKWVLGEVEGCYTASFDPGDFARKLGQALEFAAKKGRTKGRERIIELGLDSKDVARKIIDIYQKALGQ